jgi:Ca2+-binding RTX toxin-like protein
LRGGAGNDILVAGAGNNTLYGGRGHDLLIGGRGHDTLIGGPGPDTIIDTKGAALVRTGKNTGPRDDFVYTRDSRADDVVICGSRHTIVVADKGDKVRGRCGLVIRRGPIRQPERAIELAGQSLEGP